MPWTKFRKKRAEEKGEHGKYLFDESRRKELENKAYPNEFMAATIFFGSRWLTGCLVLWRSQQLFFCFVDQCLFPLLFFQKLFSLFSHKFNWLFLLRALGGSKARISLVSGLSPLTAALMRCDKLSKLQESTTRALFLRGFPCFKRVNRVYRFDGWPKCSLVINAKKGVRLF